MAYSGASTLEALTAAMPMIVVSNPAHSVSAGSGSNCASSGW